jgi:hypothetical protein
VTIRFRHTLDNAHSSAVLLLVLNVIISNSALSGKSPVKSSSLLLRAANCIASRCVRRSLLVLGVAINRKIGWGGGRHGVNATQPVYLDVGVGRARQLNSDISLKAKDVGGLHGASRINPEVG